MRTPGQKKQKKKTITKKTILNGVYSVIFFKEIIKSQEWITNNTNH